MSASSNGITLLFNPGATSQGIILCCCELRALSYILYCYVRLQSRYMKVTLYTLHNAVTAVAD